MDSSQPQQPAAAVGGGGLRIGPFSISFSFGGGSLLNYFGNYFGLLQQSRNKQPKVSSKPNKEPEVFKTTEVVETAEGSTPRESCTITLVARKINFKDVPILGRFDSSLTFYHMFVTTGPKPHYWNWLYHGAAPLEGETNLRTESLSWDTPTTNNQNWDKAAFMEYGGIDAYETVPRSCDYVKVLFNDTLKSIGQANIKYDKWSTNSNAAIYNMLYEFDRYLVDRLYDKVHRQIPMLPNATVYLSTGVRPVPGWGIHLKY